MTLSHLSIRQRLIGVIMLVSGISILLTTITISILSVFNLEQGLRDELQVSASIVGDRNTAALVFNDDKLADNNLRVFSVKQSILRACLYNAAGQVFARYPNEQGRIADCPDSMRPRLVSGQERVEVMQPIYRMGDQIGSIYIESTKEEIEAYIRKQSSVIFAIGITALLISYLMAVRLQRGISQPVLSLAETAREVSLNKDYSIRASPFGDTLQPPGSRNELVVLTDAFNGMLQEIGERDTQLKRQNVELERARDIAESANRAKSQFLANISHELRTPLNAIIGFSSILMNQLFGSLGDQKYLEYARDINESGSHLLDIINDILDLSKAEAGKLTLNFEEVYVQKAINKCVTLMQDRAEKGKVTITSHVPKTLPTLVADRLRFIQIVLNILSNAVKFTEEGGKVDITVSTRSIEDEITHFIVQVKDTGIGMSREDIDKAFQSFGQVDSGLNRRYEGTGLGLPLTKKLIELHHGTIEIDSELAVGTTVTLTFPAIPQGDMPTP